MASARQIPRASQTSNEAFLDAMVRHQIGLQRFAAGTREEIFALLDATEADIRQTIREHARRGGGFGFDSPMKLRRLRGVLDDIREVRRLAWSGAFRMLRTRMRELSVQEVAFTDGAFKTVIPVEVTTTLPAPRRLKSIVTSVPFEGQTLNQWASSISRSDINRLHSQIQIGLVQGETAPQIARRLVGTVSGRGTNGVTQIGRRDSEAIVLTANNHIANQSRREYFKENAEFFDFELYLATLDSVTTKICASLDGQKFKIGEGPIPPLHVRCRSLRSAIIDDEAIGERPARRHTQQQLLREYSKANGIVPPATSRDRLPRGTKGDFDKFSRSRIRELTGQVPAKTTYQQFLERQSAANQDDYLGKTKGRLFRRGDVKLDRFVDEAGNEKTLQELAKSDAEAFRRAGLDPDEFL